MVVLLQTNDLGGVLELRMNNAATLGAPLGIIGFTQGSASAAEIRGLYQGSGKGDIAFRTHNGTSPGTRMTIQNDGNVGIGTTNPTSVTAFDFAKLDVRGKLWLTEPTDNYVGLYLSRSGGPSGAWNSPGGTWAVYRYGSGNSDRFCIGIAGVNEPFCISNTGNTTISGNLDMGSRNIFGVNKLDVKAID